MDQKQYIKHIARRYAQNLKIVKAKSHDYAHDMDPFWNFRLCEVLGLCSVEVGILVRLLDKIGRIANLMNWAPAVKDETVSDTISDAQNYLGILDAYLEHKEEMDEDIETLQDLGLMPRDDEFTDTPCMADVAKLYDEYMQSKGFEPCNSHYAEERCGRDGDGI